MFKITPQLAGNSQELLRWMGSSVLTCGNEASDHTRPMVLMRQKRSQGVVSVC